MIVWTDTETTGLDPERGDLLEVALVVTDDNLVEVAATSFVVQPFMPLGFAYWQEHLDPFIQDMHGKNGLLDAIERGEGVGLQEAVTLLFAWARTLDQRPYVGCFDLKKTPLAGSTVGFDRAWLRRHMPMLESLFSYRSIDVSSLTEIAKRWSPTIYEGRLKAKPEEIAHRALADVRESIAYLRYYRESGFVGGAK